MLDPDVPVPAPAATSPVGCSSTMISITFDWGFSPSLIFDFTLLKILVDFIALIDLLNNISLKGSPSSVYNLFLMTFSFVI